MLLPPALNESDRVAIICPAGRARINDVENAAFVLERHGLKPEISPMVYENRGTFSGTVQARFDDFMRVWTDHDVRAVICARGGYGAVHLLDRLDIMPLRDNAKWLVGFSDICALHALLWSHGIASIHGPMAKHICADGGNNPYIEALMNILAGGSVDYRFEKHPFNRAGFVQAALSGGNLSVLTALSATRFGMIRPNTILLIEDIAEPVYKVQRMLWQLRFAGILPRLAGLLVGAFTDYSPDPNHESMQSMIRDMVDGYDYPVAFDVPIGHGSDAMPVILNVTTELCVNDYGVRLKQCQLSVKQPE